MRLLVPLLLAAAIGVAGCSSSSGDSPTATIAPFATSAAGLPTTQVTVGERAIGVEVAATPATRQHGLSDRASLPSDAGMLFDLGQTQVATFWMKDMHFPLDMVWIDENHTVAGVAENVQPQPGAADSQLTLYHSTSPVRYVLELNAGAAARLGFTTGAQVSFELPPVSGSPAAG